MFEIIQRKFSYLLLLATFGYVYSVAFIYSFIFKRRKKDKTVKKIAAVWYNPPDLIGSNLRLGYWKKFFENEGIQYDNFHVSSINEFQNLFENGSWTDKYKFYRINLMRRLKQFFQLKNYDVVWIDRGFVINYPLKKAFLEKCIKRMVNFLVVDSTDGQDYESNPELVLDTMKQADRVTVGFDYLKMFYLHYFDDVVQFNWTIPEDDYIIKNDYEIEDLPIVGWMGSPGNFYHVKKIEKELSRVAQIIPFKFVYICRAKQDINIPDAVIQHHKYDDDYYKIIAGFDVGIAPCFGETITHKGKIAMKHQEFLICAIPQICSPVAISEFVRDGRDVLISKKNKDWTSNLVKILKDKKLRKEIAENSRLVFQKHYTFESEFSKVKQILTNFKKHESKNIKFID